MRSLKMSKEMGTGIDVMLQVGSGRQIEADETVGYRHRPDILRIWTPRLSTFMNADWH
jgi:hypothetical protein